MYRYEQLQGYENCEFTIFAFATTLTSLVIFRGKSFIFSSVLIRFEL
jgi:hypothetical protein